MRRKSIDRTIQLCIRCNEEVRDMFVALADNWGMTQVEVFDFLVRKQQDAIDKAEELRKTRAKGEKENC